MLKKIKPRPHDEFYKIVKDFLTTSHILTHVINSKRSNQNKQDETFTKAI